MKLKYVVYSFLLFSICSCNSNMNSNSESLSNEVLSSSIQESVSLTEENSSTTPPSLEGKDYIEVNKKQDIDQEKFYNDFYNYTSDIEMTLKFSNESIYNLAQYSDDDYKKEMYHPCDLTIKMNDVTYFFKDAGARMKGNTSRNKDFANENGDILAPVHFKVSVSQTFDDVEDNDYYTKTYQSDEKREETKKRRIGNAKKFDIKYNKNLDHSFTRQIYAYNAYESEGLIVQKNNLVKVNIESDSSSLTTFYELQECIDEEFIERRFESEASEGDLYKCTYTSSGPASLTMKTINKVGIEKGSYSPSYDLKTNKKTSDFSILKNLITKLNNDKSPSNEFKNELDKLIDVESFIKYCALSWVIGNPDDMRNNYNNYYLYFESLTNKAIFIPYDFDRCFGIMKDWPIQMQSIPHYTTKTNTGQRNWQQNPLLWRTIISTTDSSVNYSKNYPVISEYQQKYNELCLQYANKYLDVNKYQQFVNQFVYAQKDISIGGDINLSFKEYCDAKLATFNE